MIKVLKSKIHEVVVTESNFEYEGSITICADIMSESDIQHYEEVDVNNKTTGERIRTYVIPGERGVICLNGAAAHKFKKGDVVHVLSWCFVAENAVRKPLVVKCNDKNQIIWP